MKAASIFVAASALAAGAAAFSASANAAPITLPSSLQNAAAAPIETVQWRWRGVGWRGWGPGLAAGAVVGGAIAASQYGYYNNYYDDYAYAGSSYGYAPSYGYSAYGSGPSGYNSYNYNYAPSSYSYSYGPSGYNSYAYSPGYRSRYYTDYGTTPGYNYSPSGYNSRYYAPSGATTSTSYAAGDSADYCKQRYRSYDPASGTYLGYDGQRHPCP